MKKELPIMIFHKDNQEYYGGDQDWFPDEWARRAGCASVCAADMACFYEHKLDISYPDFLELMIKMFKLNTPGIMVFLISISLRRTLTRREQEFPHLIGGGMNCGKHGVLFCLYCQLVV